MATLRIRGDGEVPVGKIVGVIRNYAKHASELGHALPEHVTFFLKPSTSVVHDGGVVRLPPESKSVHHEVELAVVIGRTATRVEARTAPEYVLGYAVCLDMTARDLQDELSKRGLPWEQSKGFDSFFPISEVVPAAQFGDPNNKTLVLRRNGREPQRGSTGDMLDKVPELVSQISRSMTLERGDVIATGTPQGVGPVASGDVLEAEIVGQVRLRVTVEAG